MSRLCIPLVWLALLSSVSWSAAGDWACPEIPQITARAYPRIAATAAELERLRAARSDPRRAVRRVVASVINEADAALQHRLEFPPRGGQHNQWYQCDECQIALETVDATHHRCPRCEKVYSGEPYDDVIYSKIHYRNLRNMRAAAWAYAITGNHEYGRFAAEVLRGYADRYRQYPYHSASRSVAGWGLVAGGHLFEQTLNEANAMANYIAPAYDLIKLDDVLSKEQDQAIREGLLVPMLKNIAKNRSGKSNWQTWHNAGMLAAGAVLGDNASVERALCDPKNGFAYQMQVSVSDEGMWYENSWGYHFYTLRAMIQLAEHARRLGIDLWGHPRMKPMFTVPIGFVMPDGRLPRFGDDVNTRVSSIASALEFAFHAYRDPAMEPYLPESATWDSVLLGREVGGSPKPGSPQSRLFPGAGYAILRTIGPKQLATAVTFGPYGGFHGHYDKLSFVFFGYGRELGVDPGRARSQAYRLPIHRHWYKATLAHNTVVVDGKSQLPAKGKLLDFKAGEGRVWVVTQCAGAHPGVVHTRLLLQTPDYLLIADELKAEGSHRFDWFYHNRGNFADDASLDAKPADAPPDATFSGMEYVENTRTAATDGPFSIGFVTGEVTCRLVFDAAAGTEVLLGDGVGASVEDRVPLVRVTRRGSRVRFIAVLEPSSAGDEATVQSVSCQAVDGDRLDIEIIRGDRPDKVVVGPNWQGISVVVP